ncbi:hypothetical protein, partial [Aeromonas media]|uniref:hypothetical protein n=1 Tax=Aeromonas media TaxID=651 RepID=UPI003D1E0FFA
KEHSRGGTSPSSSRNPRPLGRRGCQEDKVSARASVLSYYQCIDSSAGFSDSDCLQITGDEDFIGTVVDAINKTEASQKVKNRFLVSPIN